MSLYQVPAEIANANDLEAKLAHLGRIKRSFSVFRIDCGSCNGCEIEIFAAITPMWDPERFGFKLVASPRHADILVVSGPITRQMYYPLLRAYEAAPDPKIVVGLGACGASGGIFHDSYAVHGGADKVVPVDVFVPGCPPHPASIIYGLAVGVGILDQKISKVSFENDDGEIFELPNSLVGNILFERDALAKAKWLMSYIFGRRLYDIYIQALKNCDDAKNPSQAKQAVMAAIKSEEDPRFGECLGILHNEIYPKYVKTTADDLIDVTSPNAKELLWKLKW
ncbi:NADH-quinone oxidoreductase subunit B family protein [Campylobacter gastrosuis]|uniref:NADH-quinone oxidoreductase subunit B family protein n=1 Tax=Campylobacter gastrosuis TaxID=2974576 RepID=A0ABT7HQB3_9BACT|nr:NADH-quinone oxidoreductase subunit B family protein [Campylobacter gastrosuis]MDL0089019.1 NADH-quinone oxidoreductase subunit B family protein [Campylobacter gastrosuis]